MSCDIFSNRIIPWSCSSDHNVKNMYCFGDILDTLDQQTEGNYLKPDTVTSVRSIPIQCLYMNIYESYKIGFMWLYQASLVLLIHLLMPSCTLTSHPSHNFKTPFPLFSSLTSYNPCSTVLLLKFFYASLHQWHLCSFWIWQVPHVKQKSEDLMLGYTCGVQTHSICLSGSEWSHSMFSCSILYLKISQICFSS